MKIYQVGGAVRDKLLGLPVTDHDWVVVGSSPQEMESLGYKPVGRDFPVFLHPQTHEEYALARTERKTAPGYKGFIFNTAPDVTLEEDLRRRDLTINAIAADENGNLIDPCNGQADLDAGILRHVSPAFVEDPLRVLRAARFAARFGFRIVNETNTLMREIAASGELKALVAERVWQEMERALGADQAVRFFEVLRDCDALVQVLPEIDRLYGVPQPLKYHPEIDSGVHSMMVLAQACRLSTDITIRFAALVHDLGKATTAKQDLPGHPDHGERGVELINNLCDRFRIPNKYRQLAILVARHHLDCHRVNEMRPDTIVKKLEALDAFRRPQRFEQFLIACTADARGRKGLAENAYPQAEQFRRYLLAAKAVNTAQLNEQGPDGVRTAEALRQLRRQAVAVLLEQP